MLGNPESTAGLKAFLAGHYAETLGVFPSLILLAFLAFIVHIDTYIKKDQKRTMRIIVLAVFSLVVQNYLEYRLAGGEVKWLARTLTAVYGYSIRPAILILLLRVIAPRKRSAGWSSTGRTPHCWISTCRA